MLREKILLYEECGDSLFNNYQIGSMREHNATFKVSRLDSLRDYAVINLHPDLHIEKNFMADTIDIFFLDCFRKIECYYLIDENDFTRIDFKLNGDRYLLFKGYPSKNKYLNIDTLMSIKAEGKWRYIKYSETG